jgi:hypothetical protein
MGAIPIGLFFTRDPMMRENKFEQADEYRLRLVGAVCSPELVEGSTAIKIGILSFYSRLQAAPTNRHYYPTRTSRN